MALPNTFKSFVGVLLNLGVFSDSVSLLKTTLHWVLLVSQKMFFREDCQGSLSTFYPFV